MSKVTIYHNPRCSKSRQTLEMLEEKELDIEIIRYLETPPSVDKLKEICSLLGKAPLELIRVKEGRFKELGFDASDTREDNVWLEAMHENPILIERPIVLNQGKAALGRPPEDILTILD
ncbi:MAG: arsenate reductase (glutaredoxin) [Pseudomonadota bacterium]